MSDRRNTVHVLGEEPRQRLEPARLRLEEESESLGRPARAAGRATAHFGQAPLRGGPLQFRGGADGVERPQELAQQGLTGSAQRLPYLETIQAAFGAHDVSGVQAFVGGPAAQAARALGAQAYATGSSVAFRESPSLHTAAHEAAHVVQQRAGVHLKDGVGRRGDAYEQHADAVADLVVRGESAESLLSFARGASPTAAGDAVQLQSDDGPVRGSVVTMRASGSASILIITDVPSDRVQVGDRGVIEGTDFTCEITRITGASMVEATTTASRSVIGNPLHVLFGEGAFTGRAVEDASAQVGQAADAAVSAASDTPAPTPDTAQDNVGRFIVELREDDVDAMKSIVAQAGGAFWIDLAHRLGETPDGPELTDSLYDLAGHDLLDVPMTFTEALPPELADIASP